MLAKKIKASPTLEQFVEDFFGIGNSVIETVYTGKNCNCGPKAIIKENENEYILSIPLPGFKKEDIDISMDDSLVISSNVENDEFKKSFENKYVIPDDVDRDKIGATMEDGILKVTVGRYKELPKSSVKKIEIK